MLPNKEKALSISRDLLDRGADALVSGDFDLFASLIAFPYTLDMQDVRRVYDSAESLRALFAEVYKHLQSLDVSILHRNCVAASFQSPEIILATYETRLISNGFMVEEPFPCMTTLGKSADGIWRTQSASYPSCDGSAYRTVLTG